MDKFDLIVIGAGPGGYVAAIRAAQLGMKVACVEKDKSLGGTCLNVGCIPSKALLDSSEHFQSIKSGMDQHGIVCSDLQLDLSKMMARKTKVVRTLTTGVKGLLRKNHVERITGVARFLNSGTVEVEHEKELQQYSAERILIASGSVPIEIPNLPFDGHRVISSTEALSLKEVPNRLLVIGAGAIGLELGSVWNRLGAEVEVVEILDRIVPGMDGELVGELQKSLEKQGLKFRLQTRAQTVSKAGKGCRVTLDSSGETSEVDCDVVLVAVGRKAFSEGLRLDALGTDLDDRGRIVVNEQYETTVAGVYAIGDVIAGPMLAHKAEEEGIAAVEGMAGGVAHVNYGAIPNVVYTWPELASVGLSEEEAQEKGPQFRIGRFPFMANGRARCMDESEGLVKIIADSTSDRILGMHIFGARASDLIAEAAIAMEFGASAEDIARSVHAHPTLAECIKEAALAVHDRAINI